MKKKFINALVLGGVAVLGLAGLVGCGEQQEDKKEETKKDPVTAIKITNKDDLKAEWRKGEAEREVKLSFEGATVQLATAMTTGQLVIESSDTSIVMVDGLFLYVEETTAVGNVTITATYTNSEKAGGAKVSDSIELTVLENEGEKAAVVATVKEFCEAEYDATAKINKQAYFVTGTISEWKGKDGTGSAYGNFMLKDDSGEVYIYGASATNTALLFDNGKWVWSNPKDFQSNEWTNSLKIGDEVSLLLTRCDYGTTIEGNGVFVKKGDGVTAGNRVAPTSADFAEVLSDKYTVNKAYRLFETEATIVGFGGNASALEDTPNNIYGNMYLTDGTNQVKVYGATAETNRITWYKGKYSMNTTKTFQENEVTKELKAGDKIKFTCVRSDYNGEVQISLDSLVKVVE